MNAEELKPEHVVQETDPIDPQILLHIYKDLEKIKWNNSKNKFEFGISEVELTKKYDASSEKNLDMLLKALNEQLELLGKQVVPIKEENKVRYVIVTSDSGLELDDFTTGVFGVTSAMIELSDGRILREDLIEVFDRNKNLSNRMVEVRRAIRTLTALRFLRYDTKEDSYKLGQIGQFSISTRARKELAQLIRESLGS